MSMAIFLIKIHNVNFIVEKINDVIATRYVTVHISWIVLAIIVWVLSLVVVSSWNKKKHLSSSDNKLLKSQEPDENKNQKQDENKNQEHNIYNPVQTAFQCQLQENTKTPQQVDNEEWAKERKQIITLVNVDYQNIKRQLLDKAQTGQYSTENGYKIIYTNYCCAYLMQCVYREHFYNPTGRRGTSSFRTNQKVTYSINKMKQYNLYLSTIKELASTDNISITPFFVEIDPVIYQKENKINLPYTYVHEWRTTAHKIKAYLKCSIKY